MQRVGYLNGKAVKDPPGYGNTLKLDDHFDIAFFRLDTDSYTPNLRWGPASWGDAGYFHIARGEADMEIAGLPSRNSDYDKCRSIAHNKILDGVEPDEAWNAARGTGNPYLNLCEDKKKEEELLYPSEPLNEHPDFPELENSIKLKIEPAKPDQNSVLAMNSYIVSFQKALAEATGLGVVSDSWAVIDGEKLLDKEMKLRQCLEEFSSGFNYNWSKSAGILELRHRKSWKNRLNQYPSERIAEWSENTKKNKMISLDDLAGLANLTYEQAEESVKADKVLGISGLYRPILTIFDTNGSFRWMRLYSALSREQRATLTSVGLNGESLSPDQWPLAQFIFDRIGSAQNGATFILEALPNDKQITYQFKVMDNDAGKEDRRWKVALPQYTAPPEPGNAKH